MRTKSLSNYTIFIDIQKYSIKLPCVSASLHEQEGEFHVCRGRQVEEETVCHNDDEEDASGGGGGDADGSVMVIEEQD